MVLTTASRSLSFLLFLLRIWLQVPMTFINSQNFVTFWCFSQFACHLPNNVALTLRFWNCHQFACHLLNHITLTLKFWRFHQFCLPPSQPYHLKLEILKFPPVLPTTFPTTMSS
jgi:hypothetical protein